MRSTIEKLSAIMHLIYISYLILQLSKLFSANSKNCKTKAPADHKNVEPPKEKKMMKTSEKTAKKKACSNLSKISLHSLESKTASLPGSFKTLVFTLFSSRLELRLFFHALAGL